MKKSVYTSYDELPLLLSVKQLVDLMGVSESSIYELIQEVCGEAENAEGRPRAACAAEDQGGYALRGLDGALA